MPANHQIDSETKLLITTWEGAASDSEFIDTIQNYQENFQSKPEHHAYNEYVDLCKVTEIDFSSKGLQKISEIASSTDIVGIKRKLAFVVNSKLFNSITTVYEAYRSMANSAGKEIRVFNNGTAALEWLNN